MDKPRRRGERRDRTRRHIQREAWRYHRVVHRRRWGACNCHERQCGRFRKVKAPGCRCRGKRRGTPKRAGSLHKARYKYRITTMRRIWNRRLAGAWPRETGAGEPEDSNLAGGAITGRRRGTRSWV